MNAFENGHKGESTYRALSFTLIRKVVTTMKGGFSFCGINIADIGLEYVPENKDTYVYGPGETEVHEETFDGHDGGYIYGTTRKPKEFILRCFYEDKNISDGIMSKAHSLFRVGKSGLLIFDRRPWCYYYATVTSVDSSDMYNYRNGLLVVTMKSYYPYARSVEINGRMLCNLKTDPWHDDIVANSAVLESEEMVPPTSFDSLPQSQVLLYNPGTERASVGIVVAGEAGDGVTIRNRTTGQSCRYVGFKEDSGEVYTDGISGKTIYSKDGEKGLAFLYHDYGFIELEPAFPILRDLYVSYKKFIVTAKNMLYQEEDEKEWYVGKYIYLDNGWYKIQECLDEHRLLLETEAGIGAIKTCVVLMNEIEIETTQDTNLTKISFMYKPTFA